MAQDSVWRRHTRLRDITLPLFRDSWARFYSWNRILLPMEIWDVPKRHLNQCSSISLQATASNLLASLEKERELLKIFLKVSQLENSTLRRMNLSSFLMVSLCNIYLEFLSPSWIPSACLWVSPLPKLSFFSREPWLSFDSSDLCSFWYLWDFECIPYVLLFIPSPHTKVQRIYYGWSSTPM